MNRSDDPFAPLPVAVVGVGMGLVLMFVSGYFAYNHWTDGHNPRGGVGHATIEGTVEWAGWRTSAARGGPDRFLQIRFEDDRRGFIVAAGELPGVHRNRFEQSRGGVHEISGLVGTRATVAVDSALLEDETPYMSGLRVGEETIIPVGRGTSGSSPWGQTALLYLYWGGTLLGIAILGVSVQHVVVCVRYWRSGAV